MDVIRRLIRWIISLFWEPPTPAAPAPAYVPERIDWFVWESERIQKYGYAPWFDHWRYDGTEFAEPDPTPEQRRIVFMMSEGHAMEVYGRERVLHTLGSGLENLGVDMNEPAYSRARYIGQDPVGWAMKKMQPMN